MKKSLKNLKIDRTRLLALSGLFVVIGTFSSNKKAILASLILFIALVVYNIVQNIKGNTILQNSDFETPLIVQASVIIGSIAIILQVVALLMTM